jgi:DNA-binding LacI/PurR family transcriptional regulator
VAAAGKLKYRQIYERVHGGIVGGEYAVGQRIPTEMELAQEFGASRVTVARALRDLERQGLLIRRRGAGSFVSQVTGTGGQLLALVGMDSQGLFTLLKDAIVRAAQQKGRNVLLGRPLSGGSEMILREAAVLCEQYVSRKVEGVFFAPLELPSAEVEVNLHVVRLFEQSRIPIVLLDRDVQDFPDRSHHDLVAIDNVHAGYVLTEHLLEAGHRRIAFISHERSASSITARIAGYREALASHGIEPDPNWVVRGDCTRVEFIREYVRRIRPDAFVCVNDEEAAKLMRTLAALAIKVPDKIAVVGIDNDKWATFLPVALTTIRQPVSDLATAAMRLMLERIAQPAMPAKEVCLTCELLVRESSGVTTHPAVAAGRTGGPASH